MMMNTHKTVIWTCFVVISTYAWLLRIFELPYFRMEKSADGLNAFDSYFNSFWCTVITMTTVGYGDLVPSTCPGKVLAMTIALTGSFLTSIVIVTVTQTLELPTKQVLAMRHIHITRFAAITLQKSFNYFMAKKKFHMLSDIMLKRKQENSEQSHFLMAIRDASHDTRCELDNKQKQFIENCKDKNETLHKEYEDNMKIALQEMLNACKEFKSEESNMDILISQQKQEIQQIQK